MRHKLNGSKILVAANNLHPFFYANYHDGSDQIESLEGFEGHTLQALSQCLNFTFELSDNGWDWGQKQEDGSWSGMIGEVHGGVAQIALSGITVTPERNQDILFAYPHFITSVTFTTPLPQRNGYSSSLLGPFDKYTWFILLCSTIVLFLLDSLLKEVIKTKTQIRWTFISMILSQPIITLKTRLLSVRLLIVSWLLSVFVLKNYYSGELFGLMTMSTELERIETIHDLANALRSGKMKIITFSYNYIYLMTIEDLDLNREEGKKYLKILESFSIEDIIDLLKNEPRKYTMTQERLGVEYWLNLYEIPQYLPPTHKDSNVYQELQAIVLQKNSELEEGVNECLADITKAGLIYHWNKQYFMKKFKRFHSKDITEDLDDEDQTNNLNLDQLFYIFRIFLFGICLAIILIIIEFIHKSIV